MNWHLIEGRSESGPFTLDQLRQLAGEGRVTPNSQLQETGTKRVLHASQILGLFPEHPESEAKGPVFRQAPGMTVDSHAKHVSNRNASVLSHDQRTQPSAGSRTFRRGLAAIALAGLALGGYLVTRQAFFPPQPPADLQAEVKARLGELDKRIVRWKSEQVRVEDIIKTLEEDRQGLLWQFRRLGIDSSAKANDTARGQALLLELRSLTDQLSQLRKKQEEYSLAIFQSESKLRTIERSLATSRVLANEEEIAELFAATTAADSALAAETGSSPDVELDQKLNTLLADLSDDEVSKLEWGSEATVILLDLQPRDLTVSCFEQPGVKIEGGGRYRRILVPDSLLDRELRLEFSHPKLEALQYTTKLAKGQRESLAVDMNSTDTKVRIAK